MHSRLPQVLRSLLRGGEQLDRQQAPLRELYGNADLFNQDKPLRPVRLAVVDLTNSQVAAPQEIADPWTQVTSSLSPLVYSPRVDVAAAGVLLLPLKALGQMSDEVFAIFVESCLKSGRILREAEFIKQLVADIDMSNHARVKAVILYLLNNLRR